MKRLKRLFHSNMCCEYSCGFDFKHITRISFIEKRPEKILNCNYCSFACDIIVSNCSYYADILDGSSSPFFRVVVPGGTVLVTLSGRYYDTFISVIV